MERRRRGDIATNGQTRRRDSSDQHENSESNGRGGGFSAERLQSQFEPRRSLRIARQEHGSRGDVWTDQQSPRVRDLGGIETIRRSNRGNVPTYQETSIVRRSEQAREASRQTSSSAIEFIIAFEHQPPAEIRTGISLPTFVVNLKLRGRGLNNSQPPIDDSNLNAMAALVTADGETPMTSAGNNVVMRPMTATPRQRHAVAPGDIWWKFEFMPGEISLSGYFKIWAVVMHSPTVDRGNGLEMDSPVQLLSVTSRLIHVHAFGPLLDRRRGDRVQD
ncbi:MAG: hypothetical protein Q9217_002722 [Psora testacea]